MTRVMLSVLVLVLGVTAPGAADEVVDGRLGPGALYRLVRPTHWNGRLVVYAHGYVTRSLPVTLPAEADLVIGLLVPQGFAVAYSSYSENGWAVKDGAQRTHQMIGAFTARFGAPSRTYIGGASMGGLIAIKLVEQHAGAFDGIVAACAAAGGTRQQYDYLANTRALFDATYPGVLPGDAAAVPPGTDIPTAIVQPALLAMQTNPTGALVIAAIDQTPAPFSNAAELAESITTALSGHALSFVDLVPELHGKKYFDNRDVLYTGALSPLVLAGINATVDRFVASPSALNYMEMYYEPSGDLEIPMLMLSTSRDPVLPGFHQESYLNRVSANGQSDWLVQRTVDRYGHCNFTPDELADAFTDLVAWVELGIKPIP